MLIKNITVTSCISCVVGTLTMASCCLLHGNDAQSTRVVHSLHWNQVFAAETDAKQETREWHFPYQVIEWTWCLHDRGVNPMKVPLQEHGPTGLHRVGSYALVRRSDHNRHTFQLLISSFVVTFLICLSAPHFHCIPVWNVFFLFSFREKSKKFAEQAAAIVCMRVLGVPEGRVGDKDSDLVCKRKRESRTNGRAEEERRKKLHVADDVLQELETSEQRVVMKTGSETSERSADWNLCMIQTLSVPSRHADTGLSEWEARSFMEELELVDEDFMLI